MVLTVSGEGAPEERPWLGRSCFAIALILGAVEAWAMRSTMFPDGVSYLDIGDAFWRGDWHNAVNAYWSPLYPFIVGFFLRLFNPSPAQEFPLVHWINFLDYIAALAAFHYFLRTFLERYLLDEPGPARRSELSLPYWAWLMVGYSAFIIASLSMVTMSFVSGDMIVTAVIYFAAALLLKMRRGVSAWHLFALLGLALGVGYLAKAVMFLMSVPFVAAAAATQPGWAQKFRSAAIAAACFALVAGPLVVALSLAKGRPTFGDSGRINYVMNVGTTQFFTPHESSAAHPVRKLPALPEAYEYATPIAGTYPLWYDPSYWHEGIQPHFDPWRQVRTLLLAAAECAWISFNVGLGLIVTVGIAFLHLVGVSIRRSFALAAQKWILWAPALAGIGLYSLVVIEPRYVAALFCILWIVAFSGVRLTPSNGSRTLMASVIITLAVLTCATAAVQTYQAIDGRTYASKDIATPVCARAAEAAIAAGVKPGDKFALISDWLFPSRQGSYIARLARARIVAEARPEEFWSAAPATRAQLFDEFAAAGATAVLISKPPQISDGWLKLADSDYYLHVIANSHAAAPDTQKDTHAEN